MTESTLFVRKPLREVNLDEPFTLTSNLENKVPVISWVWYRLPDDDPTAEPMVEAWTGSKWSDFVTLEFEWDQPVIVLESR